MFVVCFFVVVVVVFTNVLDISMASRFCLHFTGKGKVSDSERKHRVNEITTSKINGSDYFVRVILYSFGHIKMDKETKSPSASFDLYPLQTG